MQQSAQSARAARLIEQAESSGNITSREAGLLRFLLTTGDGVVESALFSGMPIVRVPEDDGSSVAARSPHIAGLTGEDMEAVNACLSAECTWAAMTSTAVPDDILLLRGLASVEAAHRLAWCYAMITGEEVKSASRVERSSKGWTDPNLTYGEILLPTFVATLRVCGKSLRKGGKFMDLGSGAGRAVLAAALTQDFEEARGIEVLQSLHAVAEVAVSRMFAAAKETRDGSSSGSASAPPPPRVELLQSSFFTADWTDADVVFANSTCFDDVMMARIAAVACGDDLLDGTHRISSSGGLRDGAFLITFTRRLEHPCIKLLASTKLQQSWGSATVFIQQVDRSGVAGHRGAAVMAAPVAPPAVPAARGSSAAGRADRGDRVDRIRLVRQAVHDDTDGGSLWGRASGTSPVASSSAFRSANSSPVRSSSTAAAAVAAAAVGTRSPPSASTAAATQQLHTMMSSPHGAALLASKRGRGSRKDEVDDEFRPISESGSDSKDTGEGGFRPRVESRASALSAVTDSAAGGDEAEGLGETEGVAAAEAGPLAQLRRQIAVPSSDGGSSAALRHDQSIVEISASEDLQRILANYEASLAAANTGIAAHASVSATSSDRASPNEINQLAAADKAAAAAAAASLGALDGIHRPPSAAALHESCSSPQGTALLKKKIHRGESDDVKEESLSGSSIGDSGTAAAQQQPLHAAARHVQPSSSNKPVDLRKALLSARAAASATAAEAGESVSPTRLDFSHVTDGPDSLAASAGASSPFGEALLHRKAEEEGVTGWGNDVRDSPVGDALLQRKAAQSAASSANVSPATAVARSLERRRT